MAEQFVCILVALVLGGVICVGIGRNFKRWMWTATLTCIGAMLGFTIAVVPIWLSMMHYEQTTGYGAGNGGILFACTVPTLTPAGALLGLLLGQYLDRRNCYEDESDPAAQSRCPACGYRLIRGKAFGCPECGWKYRRDA